MPFIVQFYSYATSYIHGFACFIFSRGAEYILVKLFPGGLEKLLGESTKEMVELLLDAVGHCQISTMIDEEILL